MLRSLFFSLTVLGSTVSLACPNLSGNYVRNDSTRVTYRKITQENCSALTILDTWTYRNIPISNEADLSADGLCREDSPDAETEACEAYAFTETSLVGTILNKRTPGVDHEFVSGTMTITLDSAGSLIETWKFTSPSGENMGSLIEIWKRR